MSTPAGWTGILEPGEDILWQGRPDQEFNLRRQPLGTILFGLAFTAFAAFWMYGAAQGGGFFWLFGLVHFSVGLFLAFGPPIRTQIARRNTWYTLTNRRALIATKTLRGERRLSSYVITDQMALNLIEGPPDSLHFAFESLNTRFGPRNRAIGFDDIPEGRRVLALMRDIQRNRGPQ